MFQVKGKVSIYLFALRGTKRKEQNCQSSESKPNLFEVSRVVMAFDEINFQIATIKFLIMHIIVIQMSD